MDYKKYIVEELDNFTNEITKKIMDKENVTSGDVTIEQVFELEKHYEEIANILLEIINQNKNVD